MTPFILRRYRKKVEKDEDYIRTVAALGAAVEEIVKQNNVVDIYEEFFTGVATDHSAEVPNVKTITVFKDPHAAQAAATGYPPRSAAHVSWHPDTSMHKVVVSYSIMQVGMQARCWSPACFCRVVANERLCMQQAAVRHAGWGPPTPPKPTPPTPPCTLQVVFLYRSSSSTPLPADGLQPSASNAESLCSMLDAVFLWWHVQAVC
eukprot:364310-Chlamydomonas_euryale.AAC.8